MATMIEDLEFAIARAQQLGQEVSRLPGVAAGEGRTQATRSGPRRASVNDVGRLRGDMGALSLKLDRMAAGQTRDPFLVNLLGAAPRRG